MRVAFFTESILPHVDGVSRTLARLFRSLEERGVDFRVFAPMVPGPEISWALRVHQVRSVAFPLYPDYKISLPWGHGLAGLLDRDPPDLVHVVSPTPMALWAQGFARKRKIPVVASFHTDFVSYFRYYGIGGFEDAGWRLLRRFYNRCAAVYAPSLSTVRELQRHGIGNVQLWSRGIDLRRFHPRFRDPELRRVAGAEGDMPLLLFVGRLVREKDLEELAEIHRRVAHPHRLALVGDGPVRAELEAALPDAHFAGHQSGESLARWYASADAFVFPSTTETFGNVVLEAFASGVPAVVANRGGPPDLVEVGVTGLIARPNDPEDFARCVDELLADPDRRRAMGAAARGSAERDRDWEAVNGRLLESYQRVIAASP